MPGNETKRGGKKLSKPTKSAPKPVRQADGGKRSYLKQSDVPASSLEDALRVAGVLFEHFAGRPTSPLQIATALNVDPKGSQIRLLTGAAIAYGLIDGGAQASTISPTDLAKRIARPKSEGEDLAAKREAMLRPRVFGEFLKRYDQNPVPRPDIAVNVLEELGVPRDKAEDTLQRILTSAQSVGFLRQIKGKNYVDLQSILIASDPPAPDENGTSNEFAEGVDLEPLSATTTQASTLASGQQQVAAKQPVVAASPKGGAPMAAAIASDLRRKRVFVTHGKNRALVEPIKKLLEFGELEPIVSVERQSVSKPVPEKVMDDMRKCGAAIIHVEAEENLVDGDGNAHNIINPNVLIEIGAAMAIYGRRFILLVRDGIKLPSNLQGLYEVRYSVDNLDASATIKLLEAIKDIKNYDLPSAEEGAYE